MKKKVIIKVAASAGAGKSTMAELLTMFLKNNDFDVTHIPMEELNWIQRAASQDQRFQAIKENSEIVVEEVQLLRDGSYPKG